MAALLAGVGPGDEVIMPSFTFVSTANAFVLRGATPVFVDVDPDTLNIDQRRVAAAITPRTRAIVAVHYGGVGCDMAALGTIAAATACCSSRTRRRRDRRDARRPCAGRASATSATLSLSRDEEHLLRRGRRAAGQRRALRRARRDPAGEGHQPPALRPRRGRPLHLGRHRLVVSHVRRHARRCSPTQLEQRGADHRRAAG